MRNRQGCKTVHFITYFIAIHNAGIGYLNNAFFLNCKTRFHYLKNDSSLC